MSTLGTVLSVILAIVGVLLIIVILLQQDRAAGLGTLSATNSADSYWSKNKANSMEGALERYTKILGAIFMILALVINFIR
ncbi:MAG: preprotein translocase subunit SecG [Clostridiales bacterium]|nr:preprotein translocase subunit SecG [Clostridiales bacterium]